MRLPIPQPSDDDIKNNKMYSKLMHNALLLTLSDSYDEYIEIANEYKITKQQLPTTPKQIDMLKIENDIIVAKLYNISVEELEYILSTFKVFNSKNSAYSKTLLSEYKKQYNKDK